MGSLNPEDELSDSGNAEEDGAVKVAPAETAKSSAHLLDLSDDVLLCILQYCSPLDLKALGFTCPRLGALVLDRTLWLRVDTRGTPTGARRMRWLLTHALSVHTASLKLSGYARVVNRHGSGSPYCTDPSRVEGPPPPPRPPPPPPPRGENKEQAGSKPKRNLCSGLQVTLSHSLRRLTSLCSNLSELVLEHVIIDCNMTRISMFPQSLKVLSLLGTKCFNMEKSFLYKINDHLINLEDLNVSECLWLEPACLLPLSKLPRLTRLAMRLCAKLTEFVAYASLATRYGFKQLKVLDMRGSPVGDSEVSALGWVPLLEELYLSPALSFAPAAAPVINVPQPWEDDEPEYYKSKYESESWIYEEYCRSNNVWRAAQSAVETGVPPPAMNIGPDGNTARIAPGAPSNTAGETSGNVHQKVNSPNNGMKRTTNTDVDTKEAGGSGESSTTDKDRKGKKDNKRKQEKDNSPAKRFKDDGNFNKEGCSFQKYSSEGMPEKKTNGSSNISKSTSMNNEPSNGSSNISKSTSNKPSLDGSNLEPFSSKDQKTKKVPTKRPFQHDGGETSKRAVKDLDDCKKRKELGNDSEPDDKLSFGDDDDDDDDDDDGSPSSKRCPINKAMSISVDVGEGSSNNSSESEPNSKKSKTESEGSNLKDKEAGLNSNERPNISMNSNVNPQPNRPNSNEQPNVSMRSNVNPQPNRPSTSQEPIDDRPKLQCYIRFSLNQPPVVIDPCGNLPVMREGFSNQPVMGEGFSNQPVMREGVSNQPDMREGFSNQPVMGEGFRNQPVMREDLSNQPVMREGFGNQPVMREGFNNQPVMREGFGNQPVMREGFNNQPVMREGFSNQPVMGGFLDAPFIREGYYILPIIREDFGNQPIMGGFSNQPVMRGFSNQPVMRNSNNQPVMREGSNQPLMRGFSNQPVMREGFSNQPVMREGFSNQPVMRGSSNQPVMRASSNQPVMREGSNQPLMRGFSNQPVMRESFSNQPVMREGFNNQPIMGEGLNNQPVMGGFSNQPVMRGFNNQPVMIGFSNQPAMRGLINQPIMREGFSNQPVMRGFNNQPVMREGFSNQPVMSGINNQPVMRDGFSNQPVIMGEGFSNQPIRGEGCSKSPVEREGCSKPPVEREGCSNPPVQREGCSKPPVEREGCSNPPVQRDGCSNPPVQREGCSNPPVEGEGCGNPPVQREGSGNQPVEGEGSGNQPVMRENCCNHQPFIFGRTRERQSIGFGCNHPPQFVIEGFRIQDDNHNVHNNNDAEQVDWNNRLNYIHIQNMDMQEPPAPGNQPEEHDINANDLLHDPNNMPRHRILHVNVRQRQQAFYHVALPESVHLHIQQHHAALSRMYQAPVAPRFVYTSLVTDSAIRRFGRADGENINYVQIGPMGLVPAPYDDPHARPNRSNLRILSVTGFGNITNSSLTHLATAAPHLQSIDFTGTRVNEEGVRYFRNLRPDCDVKY